MLFYIMKKAMKKDPDIYKIVFVKKAITYLEMNNYE